MKEREQDSPTKEKIFKKFCNLHMPMFGIATVVLINRGSHHQVAPINDKIDTSGFNFDTHIFIVKPLQKCPNLRL